MALNEHFLSDGISIPALHNKPQVSQSQKYIDIFNDAEVFLYESIETGLPVNKLKKCSDSHLM